MTHPLQNVGCDHFLFKPCDCMCFLEVRRAKFSCYFGISCASGSSSKEQHTQLNDHQRDDDLEETENMDEDNEDDEQSIEQDVTETTNKMDTELVCRMHNRQ